MRDEADVESALDALDDLLERARQWRFAQFALLLSMASLELRLRHFAESDPDFEPRLS